jgi:hypothetical protein
MLARSFLPAGFLALSIALTGCKSQSTPSTESASRSISPPAVPSPAVQAPQEPQLAPESVQQPDDAALLARKTAEYAQSVTPMLNSPASRPSVIQWIQPAGHPAPTDSSPGPTLSQLPLANQPASLAAVHLKEDTSLPLILPESADQIPSGTTPTNSAPSGASDSTPTPITASTDDYEQKLHKLVQDYPRDLGNQLDYQLLRLVRDEPTPDLSDVSQLTGEDRDLLLALMDGLNNFRTAAHNNSNLMLNSKIQPLLEMADRLRSQAQLSIPTVAFCTRVISYGVYQPMIGTKFPASRNNELILYNEAANFTSIQGSDSIWRTRLRQEMVLYTDTGLAAWPDKSNAATFVDQSRNRRHDFFISRRIALPSSLAAGKYVLKITMTDEQSDRVVEASAPLELVAPEAPPAQQASDRSTPDTTLIGQ